MKSENTDRQQTPSKKLKKVIQQLRQALLWYIRDRQWHLITDLGFLTHGIGYTEALEHNRLLDDEDMSEIDLSNEFRKFEQNKNLLFLSVVDELVDAKLCELRGEGRQEEIRKVRDDAASAKRAKVMNRLLEPAREELTDWWAVSAWDPTCEMVTHNMMDLDPEIDDFSMLVLGETIIAEILSDRPALCKSAAHAGARQQREDSRRQWIIAGVQADDPRLFWLKNGLFEARQMWFCHDATVSEATRVMGKSVLLAVLQSAVKELPTEILEGDAETRNDWVQSLLTACPRLGLATGALLWDWAIENGFYGPGEVEEADEPDAWRNWMIRHIDWSWLVKQVTQELERHSHRRVKRAMELALGIPWEHVEARLGDFVGTLEEMYLKVRGAR